MAGVIANAVIVGTVADFPLGTVRVVSANNRRIAVFHGHNGFYALRDACPHQGAALSEGTLLSTVRADAPGCYDFRPGDEYVRCPWHGWEYELATGRSAFDPAGNRVAHYPTDVQAGRDLVTAVDAPVAETYPISVEDDYVVIRIRS